MSQKSQARKWQKNQKNQVITRILTRLYSTRSYCLYQKLFKQNPLAVIRTNLFGVNKTLKFITYKILLIRPVLKVYSKKYNIFLVFKLLELNFNYYVTKDSLL